METYRSGRNENDSKSFCLEIGTWVRIPPSPPRRSKVRFAPTSFLPSEKRSHPPAPLLPLFRKKSHSAHLLSCNHPHDGSLSLPAFCEFKSSIPTVEIPKISFLCGSAFSFGFSLEFAAVIYFATARQACGQQFATTGLYFHIYEYYP